MPTSTAPPNSYRTEDLFSPTNVRHADETVTEIFRVMFGFEINAIDSANSDSSSPQQDERTAIVGFSGSMRGSCQIRISSLAARSIASAMLGGAPIDEEDDAINDALGELCNMLAGGWKNGIPELSSTCALSPPTVISGRNYQIHMSKPSAKLSRTYQFDSHALYLTIYREEKEPFPLLRSCACLRTCTSTMAMKSPPAESISSQEASKVPRFRGDERSFGDAGSDS